jgi:hypothetical protein
MQAEHQENSYFTSGVSPNPNQKALPIHLKKQERAF